MNEVLRDMLEATVKYEEGYVGVHCFRNAIPSLMEALGYSAEEIKLQGRWSSDAYLRYIKMARTKKLEERRKLAEDVSGAVRSARKKLCRS